MDAWNNLIFPLSFVTTLEKQTLPAALVVSFTGQFKTDWGRHDGRPRRSPRCR
jgi:multiple sugar transport system permease protein